MRDLLRNLNFQSCQEILQVIVLEIDVKLREDLTEFIESLKFLELL